MKEVMKRLAYLAGIGISLAIFPSCTTVKDDSGTVASASGSSFQATAEADREARQGGSSVTPYPFDTCAVQINKKFKGGKAKYRRVYKGQEVLLCCTPCVKAFDAYPEAYMPRILAAVGN